MLAADYATEWDVYVGDTLDFNEETKCPGGPHLKPGYDDYFDNHPNVNSMKPAFGFEATCNKLGRYVTLTTSTLPTNSVTLCSLGIFGTRYVRAAPL